MNLLDFLVTSKARKALLKTILVDGAAGSVSEVARLSRLRTSTADRELDRMEACGLVLSEHVGKERVVKANVQSSDTRRLRRFLAAHGRHPFLNSDKEADPTRAVLAHYGAPLFVPKGVGPRTLPALNVTLAAALRLAHQDPAVAGTLPVVLWNNRGHFDVSELARLAVRSGESQTLGFFLELTDQLAGETLFAAPAQALQDKRRRRMKNFFSRDGGFGKYERDLAEMNTPAVAKRWHFLMNMSLDSFTSYFKKGTRPSVILVPTQVQ